MIEGCHETPPPDDARRARRHEDRVGVDNPTRKTTSDPPSVAIAQNETWVGRLLHVLADAVFHHPRWFFWSQVFLVLISLGYTINSLQFSTDKNDLISVQESYRRRFLEFRDEFSLHDNIFVLVESDERDKSREFVDRLADRLRGDGQFTNIYYRSGLEVMGPKALLFLSEPSLAELHRLLRTNQSLLGTLSRATNLEALFSLANRQLRSSALTAPDGIDREAMARSLPALRHLVDEASACVVAARPLPTPSIVTLLGHSQGVTGRDFYLTFDNGRIHVLIAQARDPDEERGAIAQLRRRIAETRPEVPGVNVEITGEAVLRGDEMEQARHDTEVAALIALGLTALVFVVSCGAMLRPLMATLCLLIGICYTLGFATLTVGSLNILSITLVPILIGLAIDYGVHLIFRFEEQMGEGRNPFDAIHAALGFTGVGVITSALTIAAAFYFMALTDFKGIQEMGLIAGSGLLVCLVPMLTLLPLLLVRSRAEPPGRRGSRPSRGRRGRIEQAYLKHPTAVLATGAAFTGLMIVGSLRTRFDYNLLDLQSQDSPAVRMQRKLIQSGSHSLLYCAVIADSLPEAMELEERILRLPTVARVMSLARLLTEDQEGKLATLRSIKQVADSVPLSEPDPRPVDLPGLHRTLYSFGGYLGQALRRLPPTPANQPVLERIQALRSSVARLRRLVGVPHPSTVDRLTRFQRSLHGSLRESIELIRGQDDRDRLTVEDVPGFVRDLFVAGSGRYLLQVYPKHDVWQREWQEAFVRELRTVDPEVTGSPVLFYEYTTRLKRNMERAAAYAALIVLVLVLLHFRRLGAALLALLPVVVGFVWMLGVMGWLGIPFNPVNIMSLILVIGIGVTNGVHILNRFSEEPQPVILAKSTGKAVLVSALSTMAGFGSLMVARHQGIASLGAVMSIGTATCTVASLALLPSILILLGRRGWQLAGRRSDPR